MHKYKRKCDAGAVDMEDVQIRGKGIACFLFVAMIAVSIWAKEQQWDQMEVSSDYVENDIAGAETVTDEIPARVALTFDDGPHPVYTKKLLAGLKERGVKATFFVVGENIPGREEVIAEMAKDGHLIGNHTYDHCDISHLDEEDACEELAKTSRLVEEITGEGTAYVRAPFGKWDDSLDSVISMISVKWTVDPLDWTTRNTGEIVNKVVTQTEDNDIILLHDYYESSVDAALEIVDILQERGYEFVTVEELILE